jgi:hypothetical protein
MGESSDEAARASLHLVSECSRRTEARKQDARLTNDAK